MYKPGQIITIPEKGTFRVVNANKCNGYCINCALYPLSVKVCNRYCYRKLENNDFNKYPKGYVFDRVQLCGKKETK